MRFDGEHIQTDKYNMPRERSCIKLCRSRFGWIYASVVTLSCVARGSGRDMSCERSCIKLRIARAPPAKAELCITHNVCCLNLRTCGGSAAAFGAAAGDEGTRVCWSCDGGRCVERRLVGTENARHELGICITMCVRGAARDADGYLMFTIVVCDN